MSRARSGYCRAAIGGRGKFDSRHLTAPDLLKVAEQDRGTLQIVLHDALPLAELEFTEPYPNVAGNSSIATRGPRNPNAARRTPGIRATSRFRWYGCVGSITLWAGPPVIPGRWHA